jgi:hypothetical protein
MADKLVSLVNTLRYVRHRDIWDLRWLKQRGATINLMWVRQKIRDYGISDYQDRLEAMERRLPDIIYGQQFKEEMARFIPMDVQERTLRKDKFYDFLVVEIRGLLQSLKENLDLPG